MHGQKLQFIGHIFVADGQGPTYKACRQEITLSLIGHSNSRSFKVIRGHHYWYQQKSRSEYCRNGQ